MTTEIDTRARELLEFYERQLEPALLEHPVTSVDALDQARKVLEQALAREPRLRVGFVGASQVGKSSIINGILGRRVVPAGGIGPLTAQATSIEYRDTNALEVKYHGGDQLNRLALGIRSYLRRRGELQSGPAGDEPAPVDLDALLDADLEPHPNEAGAPEKRTSKVGEHMLAQARLLLTRPDDTSEVAKAIRSLPRLALLDAVHLTLEQEPIGDAALLAPFRDRLRDVARVLGTSELIEESESEPARFGRELRIRAAGYLSPLVAKLQLHLREPLLQEVGIVDLPGVGNHADPGANVASEFVSKSDAGGLVIVFRNAGPTQDVVDMLDRSGVFNRFLWGGRDGRPPMRIVVAITYVDRVALERFNEAIVNGEEVTPEELFARVAAETTEKMRDEVARAIESSIAASDSEGTLAEREAEVRRKIAGSIEVVCVDATDFLQIVEKQPVGRFLSELDATNVPKLRDTLRALGRESAGERNQFLLDAHRELSEALMEAVRVVYRAYEGGGGSATAQWERFRERLAKAVDPLKRELAGGREAATRELAKKVPDRIDQLCEAAKATANRKLSRLKKHGESLYWPSLNAALKRGGVWEGQRLDYPGTLTRAIVDTVAADFEAVVVETVRECVKSLARSELELVERVCSAANEIDSELVAAAQVESQKRILSQQANSCVKWTTKRLEDLRDEVQEHLKGVVGEPIQQACDDCLRENRNHGRGASANILAAFERGATRAINEAGESARSLLVRYYATLRTDLDEGYLREHHDPVTAAFKALTSDELERAREADQEARRRVLRRFKAFESRLVALSAGT